MIEELGEEGVFKYQGDEEAAYRLVLALYKGQEVAEQVAKTMDSSDWDAFHFIDNFINSSNKRCVTDENNIKISYIVHKEGFYGGTKKFI